MNQWVQGVQGTPFVLDWFKSGSAEQQSEILRQLVNLCKQARATDQDAVSAILASELNPRRSAGVLLAKGSGAEILNKLAALIKGDGFDAFLLLLHLLRIADNRRKAGEAPGRCNHWWHQDLGDPVVLENIRKKYS